jgi:branched-chain amino acid transport system substrate-binding protein
MITLIEARNLGSLVLVLLLTSCSTSVPARDQLEDLGVKAAVLLDLTGGQTSLGQPAMNGFVLALQQSDPTQTPKIFAALLDTATDSATTLAAANTVVSTISIAAGFTDNDAVLLTGPLFQDKAIPFLTIGATDPALPDVIGDSIFLTPFGDNAQAAAAAEFAWREFGATVAILFDATVQYSRTLPRYFRTRFEELGGQVLLQTSYNGGCDIASLGEQVLNLPSPPSFVYLAGIPECIGVVVASLRSVGITQPILGGDGLDTPNLLTGGSEPTDQVWYTTHAWLSSETGTPQAQAFIAAYQQAYKTPPEDAFAALGYDAANLLLDVVRHAEALRPQNIAEALAATRGFQGVTGTISYTEGDHVPHKTVWIISVTQGQPSLAASFIPDMVPPPIIPAD